MVGGALLSVGPPRGRGAVVAAAEDGGAALQGVGGGEGRRHRRLGSPGTRRRGNQRHGENTECNVGSGGGELTTTLESFK